MWVYRLQTGKIVTFHYYVLVVKSIQDVILWHVWVRCPSICHLNCFALAFIDLRENFKRSKAFCVLILFVVLLIINVFLKHLTQLLTDHSFILLFESRNAMRGVLKHCRRLTQFTSSRFFGVFFKNLFHAVSSVNLNGDTCFERIVLE